MDLKNQTQKREIKFRAWDIENKQMVYDIETLEFNSYGVSKVTNQNDDWFFVKQKEFISFPNCELMQFTGLKDKNGVDIYEGDILASHRHYFYSPGVVVFEDRGWKIEFGVESHFCVDSVWESVEVVGNIHDNPEMINIAVSE